MATLIIAIVDLTIKVLSLLRPNDCVLTKHFVVWAGIAVSVGAIVVAAATCGLLQIEWLR